MLSGSLSLNHTQPLPEIAYVTGIIKNTTKIWSSLPYLSLPEHDPLGVVPSKRQLYPHTIIFTVCVERKVQLQLLAFGG